MNPRVNVMGIEYLFSGRPVITWKVFGKIYKESRFSYWSGSRSSRRFLDSIFKNSLIQPHRYRCRVMS